MHKKHIIRTIYIYIYLYMYGNIFLCPIINIGGTDGETARYLRDRIRRRRVPQE